jgi:glutaminase
MTTCGMYNIAGRFIKEIGVPSKGGISGGLLSVIPGIGSIATFSPILNEDGNSVRGIALIQELKKLYSNFNLFHKERTKFDVLKKPYKTKISTTIAAIQAATVGELEGIIRFYNHGLNLDDGDYDQRTPLHLAASYGHLEIVSFLVSVGIKVNPRDRWGATPLSDAKDP